MRLDALRHVLPEDLSSVERAGPWVFSTAWLAGLEQDLRSRIAAADPIDPGVPVPSAPWAADVLPLVAFERRGSKLYLPGSTPTLGGREAEAEALEAELAGAGLGATKVDDEELARFLEASGRLVRLGDGYAVGAEAFEVAKDVVLVECRGGGWDHARAVPRPRRHRPSRRTAPSRAARRGRRDPTGGRATRVAARRDRGYEQAVFVIGASGPAPYLAETSTVAVT